MAPIPNPRVTFAEIPVDYPVPGQTTTYDVSRTIDLETVSLNGGYLTKTLILSPEPYMRQRMRSAEEPSYSTAFKLNEPITGIGLVVVLRSEDPEYKVGDYLIGMTTWEAYTVQPYIDGRWHDFDPYQYGPNPVLNNDDISLRHVANPDNKIPWPDYMAALTIPGLTAFTGLAEYGDMQPGDTMYVSTAAGAVGSIVVQLAKISGLKVIASAGSDEKVALLTSKYGADVAFNYKKTAIREVLAKHGPINIYWDNVGGETLEAAIDNMALNGRILVCGQTSDYFLNPSERYGIKNLMQLLFRRLSIRGFLVTDLWEKYKDKFYSEMPELLASGQVKVNAHVWKGLEHADAALLEMLKGGNTGKTVVLVTEEDDPYLQPMEEIFLEKHQILQACGMVTGLLDLDEHSHAYSVCDPIPTSRR